MGEKYVGDGRKGWEKRGGKWEKNVSEMGERDGRWERRGWKMVRMAWDMGEKRSDMGERVGYGREDDEQGLGDG